MSSQRASDLLYDTAAALRLVDNELEALSEDVGEEPASAARLSLVGARDDRPAPQLPELLARARDEVARAAEELRRSHAMLHGAAAIRQATEGTTDALTGLHRAQLLVDELDAQAADSREPDRSEGTRSRLREELTAVMGNLSLQDYAAQRIGSASNVLLQLEKELSLLAQKGRE
jgi:hypothetical protein